MAGKMTREEAREHVLEMVRQVLDKHIPEDPSKPVKDGKFWEWEEMADAFDREVTGSFIEALSQLSGQAQVDHPGACPFCGCKRVRWLEEKTQRERQSQHGEVVVPRQVARCRSCGRSFSPSGAGVGVRCPGKSDTAGDGQSVPGSCADAL